MKLTKLLTAVLKKTAPIDATDLSELSDKSEVWYDKNIKDLRDKLSAGTALDLKDKIFQHLDAWYVRMLLAVLFFPIVRIIQDYMTPGETEPEHDEIPR